MKIYWGSGGIAPCILDLGTSGVEWSASCPGRFIPKKRTPDTHNIQDMADHRKLFSVNMYIRVFQNMKPVGKLI
jgi:hypothetical protein